MHDESVLERYARKSAKGSRLDLMRYTCHVGAWVAGGCLNGVKGMGETTMATAGARARVHREVSHMDNRENCFRICFVPCYGKHITLQKKMLLSHIFFAFQIE